MDNLKGIGIEIECIHNGSKHEFNIGGYHNGQVIEGLPMFKAENDSSVYTQGEFSDWGQGIEIVSKTFKSTKELKLGIRDFCRYFSKNGELDLKDVLVFNKSCGAHVHISTDIVFGQKTIYSVYPKVRDYFKKLISNSHIKSKDQIITQYNRGYSRESEAHTYKNGRNEWNFDSEQLGNGLEWRSPNMTGIETWEEFFEYWNIVIKSLEYLYKNACKWEDEEKEAILYTEENKEATDREIKRYNTPTTTLIHMRKRHRKYTKVDLDISTHKKEENIKITEIKYNILTGKYNNPNYCRNAEGKLVDGRPIPEDETNIDVMNNIIGRAIADIGPGQYESVVMTDEAGINPRETESIFCIECRAHIDNCNCTICDGCEEQLRNCICDRCEECNELEHNCSCGEED